MIILQCYTHIEATNISVFVESVTICPSTMNNDDEHQQLFYSVKCRPSCTVSPVGEKWVLEAAKVFQSHQWMVEKL